MIRQSDMRRLAEQLESIRVQMSPNFAMYEQMAKSMENIRANVLAPSQIMAQLAQQQQASISSLTSIGDQLTSQIRQMQMVQPRLALPNQKLLEGIASQAKTWQSMVSPFQRMAQLDLPQVIMYQKGFSAYDFSMKQLMHSFQRVDLLVKRCDLATRLLEPTRVFTEHFQRTVQHIEETTNRDLAKRLKVGLDVADGEMIQWSDTLSQIMNLPIDRVATSAPRSLNLLAVQEAEILRAESLPEELDEVAARELSPALVMSSDARNVLQLCIQCNEAAKTSGMSEIFRPTTRLLEVFADFSWLVPVDKRSFGDFIDCLYFTFYEGAGTDNLRYLTVNGGVLEDAECDFIWCIKHLRDKWLRHDTNHGGQRDIRKAWRQVSEKFTWLGLSCYPTTREHFRYLHRRLLEEAESFLRKIIDSLSNNKEHN